MESKLPIRFDHAAIDAAVFDLDGVVTRTASVHFAAWKALFDDFLRRHSEASRTAFRAFAHEDYRRQVDGRPRYDGVAAFLASRGIELPRGRPQDAPERETIYGLGNRKNQHFRRILEAKGVEVFPGTTALIRGLRQAGIHTALVSGSRNARHVLEAAGATRLFDVIVDGNDAAALGLAGKPAPDTFRAAVERLGVAPARAAVFEDAESGIAAARSGGFGFVVGVDRGGQEEALGRAGADLVVADLGALAGRVAAEASLPELPTGPGDLRRLLGDRRPAVFLDYDGTLTPIVDRPDLAVLSEAMRASVARLARLCPVAVVSGRDRADVERLVGLDELIYAGSHGFDIRGPDLRIEHEHGVAFAAVVARAAELLRERVQTIAGALVEPKRFAVAVHYRQVVDADLPGLEAAVDAVVEETGLRKTHGKKVYELRPGFDWDKGKAVLWLLEALDLSRGDVRPFYLGDDLTDEDAFRALAGRGIGIIVGAPEQQSAATYRLAAPDDVGRFLDALAETLEER